MKNSKFLADWLFPIASLVMFATLLAAMLWDMDSIGASSLISFSSGLLAYTMMLVVTFMASRPRYFEKEFGMPEMYEIHAVMSLVLTILIIVHMVIQWTGFKALGEVSMVSWTGWIAVVSLVLVMFTGIFSLSGLFAAHSPTIAKIKDKVNREASLWIHRLSIVAIIAVYAHLYLLPFLRNNLPFMTLLTIYTVFVLGYYLYWKLQILTAEEYKVVKIYRGTPTTWVMEFAPVKGEIADYTPGDYFFIRFKKHDQVTGEGHPFSVSSAVTTQFDDTIEFMIKDAGDWTESLKHVAVGDIATFEGPYGHFIPEEFVGAKKQEIPFVFLAGGVGLTPILSVIRHEMDHDSQRKMDLFWGLSYEEDLFMLDELEAFKKQNPNFNYHIIFSGEEVDGYPFGFITNEFLKERDAAHFDDGHFFACGPGPMMDAMRQMLDQANVHYEQLHLDDFEF